MSEANSVERGTGLRRFKPYPAYKNSGVEWMGEIPAHWEVKRIKHVSSIENSGAYGEEAGEAAIDLQLCTTAHITPDGRFLTADMPLRGFSISEASRYVGKPGDLFVVKSSGSNTNIISGKLALVTDDTQKIVFSNFLMRVRPSPRIIWSPFLAYLLGSQLTRERIQRMVATTTYPNIDVPEYAGSAVAIPFLREQRAIAAFLDHETAKIDALVVKNERLIELLQEKRIAVISDCVTGKAEIRRMKDESGDSSFSLHPSSLPKKNSGVEWLGEIPAHWEVRRLKFMLAAPLKYGANEAAELDDPDLPRYVRITDIHESDGLREETFKSLPSEVAKEYLLREGDLLFARSGATAGKTFLYKHNWGTCAYAGYLIRARLEMDRVSPEFIRYFTASSSYWQWLSSAIIQATIQNVSAERYASLWLPLPLLAEQRTIAAYLDCETARIDALIAKVREAIDRLTEYRTALISAAVTGKIDVAEG